MGMREIPMAMICPALVMPVASVRITQSDESDEK
jgi:hypothetical protein